MKFIKYLFLAASTFGFIQSNAQQDPMFTQYLSNQIYVNPAFAGSRDYMEIVGVNRQQWIGFTGAPKTTSIAMHTPTKNKSLAYGFDLLHDNIGPVNRFSASADAAYRIYFANSRKLSFGMKLGVDCYQTSTTIMDPSGSDPKANNLVGAVTPMVGAGVYYSDSKFFAGLSVPRITTNISSSVGTIDSARHMFAIAGAFVPINRDWKLRPSTQIRIAQGAPISADLTAALGWKSILWMGLNTRVFEGAGVFIQYSILTGLKIGYAVDVPLNKLRSNNLGSHEILISYSFIKDIDGLISPREF